MVHITHIDLQLKYIVVVIVSKQVGRMTYKLGNQSGGEITEDKTITINASLC